MKNTRIIVASALFACSTAVLAHGYISAPASRNFLCQKGENSNCGPVQYEPQSVEGYSGFPAQGPADGQIASGGLAHGVRPDFSPLDEQTSSRWTKRSMQTGPNSFTWTYTAPHRARSWRYYITRTDWNANLKLGRASFDMVPFCVVDGGMNLPPAQVTHTCSVPQRSGYHVILGVWEVGDTPMSFYNVIDAMFPGDGTPVQPGTWSQRGSIIPSVDLKANDSVETRVFDAMGERRDLATRIVIANDNDGQRNMWSYLLASRINAEQSLLQAGQAGADGGFNPAPGTNAVFARSGSGITRVEVQVNKAPAQTGADVLVGGLNANYVFRNGQLAIDVNVTALGDQEVSLYVYDSKGATKGFATVNLNNSTQLLRLALTNLVAGPHQLVVKGLVKSTGQVLQKTYGLMLGSDSTTPGYDYVFPTSLNTYRAGTRVLQTKTGRTYQCRPFPYSGYCVQWSPGSPQFEPGVGSNWRDAWILQ